MTFDWDKIGERPAGALARLLARSGVTANTLTVLGLMLALATGAAAAGGRLRLAAVCLILSSLCDYLDGKVARHGGHAGAGGAFLDSCADRLGEGAVFLGLLIHLAPRSLALAAVAGTALIGSYMVSYARARAEGLGLTCRVGLLQRPQRLMILMVALLLGGRWLTGGLVLLAAVSMVTFLERLRHVMTEVRVRSQSGDR